MTAAIDALWNMKAAERRARDTACASLRPRQSRIAWVHIPKTGSSLATALFHLANDTLPPAAQAPSCTHGTLLLKPEVPRPFADCRPSPANCTRRERERCFKGSPELTFLVRFPLDVYFHCTFWEKGLGNIGGHEGIDDATYATFRGRFVGMLRAPHARVVSAYRWFSSEFSPVHGVHETLPPIAEYAHRARGTQVRVIAGQSDGMACNSGYQYTARCNTSLVPDVATALTRLREGFAFVGLTEHWALSICLLHASLGGACRKVAFENTRPTTPHTTKLPWARNHSRAVAAEVATVDDPYDAALYAAAQERFRRDVRRHRLSEDVCRRICPDAPAGAFSAEPF